MDRPSATNRCVLWRPRGMPVPTELADALAKRGLAYTQTEDAFAALAEACLCARAKPARVSCVLLMVEPSELQRVNDALEAVEVHAPGVSCWAYSKSTKPELRAVTRADLSASSAPAPAEVAPAVDGRSPAAPRPVLRLTSDNFGPAGPDPGVGEVRIANAGEPVEDVETEGSTRASGSNLLTEEELAMLLGERPPRVIG